MDPNNCVKVLNWNARSLKGKEDELFNFLSVHNVHIAIITETYLKPGLSIKRDPNYFIYRNDRLDSACGGVAIVINRRRVTAQTLAHIADIHRHFLLFGVKTKCKQAGWWNNSGWKCNI